MKSLKLHTKITMQWLVNKQHKQTKSDTIVIFIVFLYEIEMEYAEPANLTIYYFYYYDHNY